MRFALLRDEGLDVTRSYGLEYRLPEYLAEAYEGFGIDLPEANGDGEWRLPLPARYIIDTDRTIRYARVHPDYTRRPEPSETVEALRALSR